MFRVCQSETGKKVIHMSFLFKVFTVFVLIQILGCVIWWRRLRQTPRGRVALLALFLLGNLPWPFFYMALSQPDPPSTWIASTMIRLFLTWQVGVLIWLYIAAEIAIILLVFYRVPQKLLQFFRERKSRSDFPPDETPSINASRRAFLLQTTRKAVWAGAIGGGAWGLVRSEFGPKVVSHTVSLPNLPRSLDGLTIAHLSDIHVGLWTPHKDIPRIMAITRDLRPDMVVITGDIIDHNPSFSKTLVQHIHLLKQVPLGVYAVIGNHDIYTGANAVSESLSSGGITMLRNRNHVLRDEGLPLAMVGVDDPGRRWLGSGGNIPLDQAMKGLSPDDFPIFLVHRPTGFYPAKAREIPLTLCGHTHGGQFGLPGGPNLADVAYEFTHGLYQRRNSVLHVSAGTGAVGLPFRLGVPAEIALLRLTS